MSRNKKDYEGRCHCGFVQFKVRAAIDVLRICNCSVCHQRGALNFRVEEQYLQLLTPLEQMNCYQWGRKTAKDYFCPTCGILPFRRPGSLTDDEVAAGRTPFHGWTVNARCLTGFNTNDIPIQFIDGAVL